MRTIKFRAWDTKKKELFVFPMDDYNTGDFFNSEQFELMQFTDLLDKYGKEIFEGDIIQAKDGLHQVIFSEEDGA